MHPLKRYREARNLKLADVALKTNLSTASISRIENWTQFPSSKALAKLIEFSDSRLTPNDFFTKPSGERLV